MRPRRSASETGLLSIDSRVNGGGTWSPSGAIWKSDRRSSRVSSAAAAGSSDGPIARTASARLRLAVRVARLLQLHHPRDAARHRRHALEQVLRIDLLPRHRDLASIEPEPAGQERLELAAHVGIDVPREERAERGPVDHQLERLDVLPADDLDVVLDVDERSLRLLHAPFVEVIKNLVLLGILRRVRGLCASGRSEEHT